jgi:hypothetical protein
MPTLSSVAVAEEPEDPTELAGLAGALPQAVLTAGLVAAETAEAPLAVAPRLEITRKMAETTQAELAMVSEHQALMAPQAQTVAVAAAEAAQRVAGPEEPVPSGMPATAPVAAVVAMGKTALSVAVVASMAAVAVGLAPPLPGRLVPARTALSLSPTLPQLQP